MKELQNTSEMSSFDICLETLGRTRAKKKIRSTEEEQYREEIEHNRQRAEVAEEKACQMGNRMEVVEEDLRKTNELLKSSLDKLENGEESD